MLCTIYSKGSSTNTSRSLRRLDKMLLIVHLSALMGKNEMSYLSPGLIKALARDVDC